MPFQLSPGVNVTEIDLTTVIPAVATTDAAIGGVFKWGPVDKPTLVVSESELASEYGKPDSKNAETWFTAANFLAYANRLHVSRAHYSDGSVTDNVRVSGYAQNSSGSIIVDSVSTGVSVGYIVSQLVSGFNLDTVTSIVDSTDVAFDAGELATIISEDADANNTGQFVVSTAIPFIEGEKVSVLSSNTLPAELSNTETYFIVGVSGNGAEFKLSTTRAGSAIVFTTTKGDGDLTITRSGSTRITMANTFSGTTGTYNFEFHNPRWSFNAVANSAALDSDALSSQHIVKNDDHYETGVDSNFDASVMFVAKYPGALGNSLKVSVCDSSAAFQSNIQMVDTSITMNIGSNTANISAASNTLVSAMTDLMNVGDLLRLGNTSVGIEYLEITAIDAIGSANNTTIRFAQTLTTTQNILVAAGDDVPRNWQYYNLVESAPGQSDFVASQGNTAANDEMHIVVIDEDGAITGVPKTVLEVWQGLSRATDAKDNEGGNLYYKDLVNQSSKWIWWGNHAANAPATTAALIASSSATTPRTMSFILGRDIPQESDDTNLGSILRAYDQFKSAEDYDISLVLAGKASGVNKVTVANYIIDNLCERRKDCVAFISPDKGDVVANATDITEDVVAFRNNLRSTSYAVLDSGYKYQYDKYNDVYRWIPLNGDIAGLCAYTDDSRDPWWSPAGFNRGNIKNVVKLAWNPKKGERDILYKNGVNPVVNFPGQGIVLFGDKTLLAKPSAFDRINVRRLFIVLEKAIATASKFTLFEFNDEFTRASFVNLVTPYLRDVQGRRGITDFAVICDETNNTGEVIDRNEFVGDIYIKPARSINFIQLNFVAVRSGVEFSEVIGNF